MTPIPAGVGSRPSSIASSVRSSSFWADASDALSPSTVSFAVTIRWWSGGTIDLDPVVVDDADSVQHVLLRREAGCRRARRRSAEPVDQLVQRAACNGAGGSAGEQLPSCQAGH